LLLEMKDLDALKLFSNLLSFEKKILVFFKKILI